MKLKERYVEVHQNKVRLLEAGKGPDVILIHGLGSQAERWASVMPSLARDYHVVAPDLIGFGYSDKPQADYSPDFFVRFVFDLLGSLGIKETILIGSSLGGQIVAESAASRYKDAIKKIVLISPTGTMHVSNPTLDAYVMAALYPKHDLIRNAYQMMGGRRKDVDEQTIERFHEAMSRPNAKMAFLSTVMGFKHCPVITPRLQSISAPSLLVWGRDDSMIPIDFAEGYVDNLKDCRFVVLDGCGHRPHVEDPEKLSGLILEFLENKVTERYCSV